MYENGAKKPPIVQTGEITTILATGVVAVDRGDGYVEVTFSQDHKWGGADVQEREISGRVHMTRCAWMQLHQLAHAVGFDLDDLVTPASH